jgi:5-methylcytosine-specific restriction endonuclease McrA
MPIKKYCSYTGCRVILDEDVMYCDKHQKRINEVKASRDREYKRNRTDRKEQDFYRSVAWIRVRDGTMAYYFGIDLFEYYTSGLIIEADTLHHIFPLKEDWGKRLDINNLFPLTEKSHQFIHNEYRNGNKLQMQDALFEMKIQFFNDFRVGVSKTFQPL